MSEATPAAAEATPSLSLARLRWDRALPALGAFTFVVMLGGKDGGYFPTQWGWTGVALAWAAALGLIFVSGARLSRLELVTVCGLATFVGWVALSYSWSTSPGNTVSEVTRDLIYPLGLLVALLVLRASGIRALLAALTAAIVGISTYGLLTRALPERLEAFDSITTYRLSAPVGYWNALGILAAIGIILALGFAARAGLFGRAFAASALVLLCPTLYFTFSRGAVFALAIGLVALFALDPRRLQLSLTLLAVAPGPALAVLLASRSGALTTTAAPLAEATRQGHRLAWQVAVLALAAVMPVITLAVLERRWRPPAAMRHAYAAVLLVGVLVGALVTLNHYGGPVKASRDAYDAFHAPPVGASPGADLTNRLFSLSGNGRAVLWDSARDEFRVNRVVGSGAGSFEEYWAQHRPYAGDARDAHGLYVEVLGELGIVGLALLLVGFLPPLAAGIRARAHPLIPFAGAAYLTFLVHAGVDWDWEMPVVVFSGLLCGAALLVGARGHGGRRLNPALRYGALAVVVAAGAFAFIGFIANSALDAANAAKSAGNLPRAASQAHKAADWAPWSPEPWKLLAQVEEHQGHRAEAIRSLRKAATLEPRDSDTWFQIGYYSPSRKERLHALAQFKRLNPLDPGLAYVEKQARRAGP